MSNHRCNAGLSLLLQSYECAQELHCDLWDFAVELVSLHKAGLTNSDLRWLLAKGYVLHAVEVIPPPDGRRRAFTPLQSFVLDTQSCFTLTEEGLRFILELMGGTDAEGRLPRPI